MPPLQLPPHLWSVPLRELLLQRAGHPTVVPGTGGGIHQLDKPSKCTKDRRAGAGAARGRACEGPCTARWLCAHRLCRAHFKEPCSGDLLRGRAAPWLVYNGRISHILINISLAASASASSPKQTGIKPPCCLACSSPEGFIPWTRVGALLGMPGRGLGHKAARPGHAAPYPPTTSPAPEGFAPGWGSPPAPHFGLCQAPQTTGASEGNHSSAPSR